MPELVGVRVLAGFLWNSTWCNPGEEFDMPKDRATDLSQAKPRARDQFDGETPPAAFLKILPDLVGREIAEPVIPVNGAVTLDAGDNPRQPATLTLPETKSAETEPPVDTLAGCPHGDKLKALAITTAEQLRSMLTLHGDAFGKVLKLAKEEAKAVAEWSASLPADSQSPAPAT